MGVACDAGHRPAVRRRRSRYRRCWERQARHDLRHLRSLIGDRRVALDLVGRRPGAASRHGVGGGGPARERRASGQVPRHFSQRRGAGAQRVFARKIRRVQPPVLRPRLRAGSAPQGQLSVAGDVGERVQRRRSRKRCAGRRLRHRDGDVTPRTHAPGAAGMEALRDGPVELRAERLDARRVLGRWHPPHGNARKHRHDRDARRRGHADDHRQQRGAARAHRSRPARDHHTGHGQGRGDDAAAVGALQRSAGLLRQGHARS